LAGTRTALTDTDIAAGTGGVIVGIGVGVSEGDATLGEALALALGEIDGVGGCVRPRDGGAA
jgi:hypothetical protein